ncbi:MAG TPA: 16S rRNA (guanine(527)-N(7))-methyltransferase RsmG [Ornithinimicrobium sp.]|nr:16S rRNA (guanine(527)-N(7))-methyltransferase RsmG [Ornithinimicrobium sp.]
MTGEREGVPVGASAGGLPEPPPAAVRLFGDRLALAVRYAEELATTGIAHGLVGPREAPRLWERHLLNCVLLESLVPEGSRVIDIGSGAGLPGLVLAVARPDVTVHLVEPLLRRTTWLERTVSVLELDNVVVHRARAEQVDLTAPVVTARAVAALGTLAGWALPLLEPGGRLLALKGATAEDELAEARPVLDELAVPQARVLRLEQEGVDPVNVVEVLRPDVLPVDAGGAGRAGTGRPGSKRPGRSRRRGSGRRR